MTAIAEFVIGIIGRIISTVFANYLLRFLDKFKRKNDRHSESK